MINYLGIFFVLPLCCGALFLEYDILFNIDKIYLKYHINLATINFNAIVYLYRLYSIS